MAKQTGLTALLYEYGLAPENPYPAALNDSIPSYLTKNKVSMAPLNCWNVFAYYYVEHNDVKNPYISPLYGNFANLAPIFLSVGDNDELYDDGVRFYEKAQQAGVDITLKTGEGMIHCYPLLAPLFPESTKAMNAIVDFIHRHNQV